MKHFLWIYLAAFLLIACKQGSKTNDKPVSVVFIPEIPDGSRALFDANTLINWEITNFGTQGPVYVSGGKIILAMGDGCSGVTWSSDFPEMNYELGLEARKTAGNDFFCGLTFPINKSFCSLIVGGWGGPVVGLSTIDALDASENKTRTMMNFEKDRWYNIRLRVHEHKISVWIDDEKVVDFTYAGHQIGIRPEVSLSKPLGICTWQTSAEIKNIWLKELD